jgi:uncharacterized protein
VGCRGRGARSRLLRVVAAEEGGRLLAVPDPRRRLPGRGAWLHLDRGCLDLALRRRAFGRALRVQGSLDVAEVQAYVDQLTGSTAVEQKRDST